MNVKAAFILRDIEYSGDFIIKLLIKYKIEFL